MKLKQLILSLTAITLVTSCGSLANSKYYKQYQQSKLSINVGYMKYDHTNYNTYHKTVDAGKSVKEILKNDDIIESVKSFETFSDYNEKPEVTFVEVSIDNSVYEHLKKEYSKLNMKSGFDSLNRDPFHPAEVLLQFLKGRKYSDDINLVSIRNDEKDHSSFRKLEGISNHSYGNEDTNNELVNLFNPKKVKFIESIKSEKEQQIYPYYSNFIQNDKYEYNKSLKIISLGNNSDGVVNTDNFTKSFDRYYENSSSSVQSLIRNETIFVKSGIKNTDSEYELVSKKTDVRKNTTLENGEEAYEFAGKCISGKYCAKENEDLYLAKAMSLRAMTVQENGFVKLETNGNVKIDQGSSFAAPRVTGLAVDLKIKYPELSLNQIRQIILTTATKAKNGGYLDNKIGWGQVDREKALKGPSDFNAGLIDEQKWFKGMYDKIFDDKGNRYFYVNMPKDKISTYSNDITSGLKGDGKTLESTTYMVYGYNKATKIYTPFRKRLAKVLDSERLYYENVAKAGLRKDGEGTLVLEGKQNYDTRTEVLDGKLVLKNDSKSEYFVSKKGTFELDGDKIAVNKIYVDGTLEVKKSANTNELNLSKDAKLKSNGETISAKKANTDGKMQLVLDKPTKDIVVISADELDANVSMENVFLEPKVIDENKKVVLKAVVSPRLLEDLNQDEKRNLTNYDVNTNSFFKEYYSDLNALKDKELLNVSNQSLNAAKAQIFTDTYTTVISSLFENNEEVENVKLTNILEDQEKDNKVKFNTYVSTNINKTDNYSQFKKLDNVNVLSYNRKITDKVNLGVYGLYSNTKYDFDKINANFKNNKVMLGTVLTNTFNNTKVANEINASLNLIDVKREVNKESVNTNLKALMLQHNILLSHNFNVKSLNTNFKPFIGNTLQLVKVFENKKENSDLGLKIQNNTLFNDKLTLGIQAEHKFNDKLEVTQRVKGDLNLFTKQNLKAELLNKGLELQGDKLDRFSLEYQLGMKYSPLKDLTLGIYGNINTKAKLGIHLSAAYEF